MARPKAENLAHRCQGTNQRGDRCGSPAVTGAALCRAHLVGRNEVRKLDRVGDRLVKLTQQALDRLEQIIRDGSDEVAERAARTILDRTVPRPGPQHAVIVNLPGHGPDPVQERLTASEVIRRRLNLLAANTIALRAAQDADAVTAPLDEIVDAELVEEQQAG